MVSSMNRTQELVQATPRGVKQHKCSQNQPMVCKKSHIIISKDKIEMS